MRNIQHVGGNTYRLVHTRTSEDKKPEIKSVLFTVSGNDMTILKGNYICSKADIWDVWNGSTKNR